MAELSVPQIDFSPIGNLPQIYKQAQADNARQQTLASLGQGGTADASALLKSGDLSLAQLGIAMQNHQDTLHQQEVANARQAVQDKLSQSNADRSYGLQLRTANRADEGVPEKAADRAKAAGQYGLEPGTPQFRTFVLTGTLPADNAGVPSGFQKNPDGTYAPLPGGPQDPAYQARVAAETEKVKGDQPKIMGPGSSIIIPNKAADGPIFKNSLSGGLSDDALIVKATQWNNGDYDGATKNVGRGAQGGATLEAIANKAASMLIEKGMSPEDAAAQTSRNMQAFKASSLGQGAEARTAGVREANLNLILRAADAAIPAALEASDKVARTGWVPINKIIQGGEVVASNPDLKRFGMANLQLAEHWARAMNPTGVMRESDRDKALSFLSTADSPSTYRAAVDQLHTQIVRERDAVKGSPSTPPAPSFAPASSAPPAPAAQYPGQPNVTSSGVKWSVQ